MRVILGSVSAEIESIDDAGPGVQAVWIMTVLVHKTRAISGTVVSKPLFILSCANWLIVWEIRRPGIVADKLILSIFIYKKRRDCCKPGCTVFRLTKRHIFAGRS